jgi:hypothetical protein
MTNYYKPPKFTDDYINSKNILKLCFNKQLYDNNILNNILLYINKKATGFALFEDKLYEYINKKYNYDICSILYNLWVKKSKCSCWSIFTTTFIKLVIKRKTK